MVWFHCSRINGEYDERCRICKKTRSEIKQKIEYNIRRGEDLD